MIRCSAPGKIFLCGEYAVLNGSPAVITAVNRRATATLSNEPDLTSPIIQAALDHTSRFFGISLPTKGPVVTSAGFRIGRNKLGLGSSAAVAAGAVGVLFETQNHPITDHRNDVLFVAQTAHRDAQGGKGSGADVACAVMGGTLIFTTHTSPLPVDLCQLHVEVVWSGRSVSTALMIDKIDAFKSQNINAYHQRMNTLSVLAATVSDAFKKQASLDIIEGTRAYAEALTALGLDADVPIVTKPHRRLINLAKNIGGAAKPSGAGGGDIAVAFFTDKEAAKDFRIQCIRHEMAVLDVGLHAPGLQRDPPE